MSRQSRTAFSQRPHLWPRANGLFSSTLRGILLRSERRAPNAWQCGYLGQTPQQDRESRVPTPIRWSIIPANLATGAYPSPETVNASPTLVECDSLNLPPVRTHCSACSFTSVPPPSELLKVLSSQPTLRACTDHEFCTSWLAGHGDGLEVPLGAATNESSALPTWGRRSNLGRRCAHTGYSAIPGAEACHDAQERPA